MSIIGDILKNNRESKNLTLKQLSEISGVGPSTISDIENGKAKHPRMDTLEKLANALSIPVNLFFNNTNSTEIEFKVPKEYTDKYKVTSRDKKQYFEEMKKATEAFFMDDEFNEDAKKEMLDLMSELFWKAKTLNKRKK
ncbi:helix-turn-helix domain-containing protein [Clostridium neonatale]|uniref:HTH-type transcriptional regulator, competence development regulator n=1 Tax=Clostridium neonatale TaxID=137838 RepID=A0AAD1YEY8_9CLOT|nr:helix-turn-helix domain-containing protein [Clostridium neonatale]CAI3198834.1 HTH-type transcriptional regulator, competence development regulator [Clostridium neonatale]CAI3202369.1 HTH-type transcriptional regulator, competence development regulator [Clostridium neonatale]CAI3216576.1 HTH-type transcriptional regulator, competence development regulator [Clostridium neonatale]CAI3224726.1 HTH-type transcriptional regulator, competence development regulator [Clostridium neonatale]CAI322934